ncbi:MAG: type II secretion system inner membrane protein GspF [Proteobacteria bacterium]|nr:type II secretion system inner membrane protein GspF [Pseudomonadota bacterium]MBU1709080.1 type II secretion system inner membrane protein GspF [Pseudomonadota bacterium]
MGAFEYSALDTSGRLKKGVLEGDTARQVRQLLRDKGLSPVSVEGVSGGETRQSKSIMRGRSISPTDLALVTRQLATLVRSGTVLEEALRAVVDQTDKARIKSVIAAVRSKILEGYTLARAFADFPSIFPALYCATVEAGEQAGHLDVVFERLADYTEFRQQIRQKTMLALLYPAFLTVVAVLVVSALLAYVVPQVVSVFENVGQELPVLTRWLIATSGFVKSYGLLCLVLFIVAAVGIKILLRNEKVLFRFHRLQLATPMVSRFVKILNAARFARSFSILTASGVSVLEGMRLSAQVIGNLPMRRAVEEAAGRVREGESLHRTLAKSGYFPPITIHLIASGEASANLEEMLERAAHAQEREIETLIAAAMGIFEPVLILVMGLIVLGIVLAILLPILDLNQLVR